MIEICCGTCPAATPWNPTQDKPRVLCHRAGVETEAGDPARLASWVCTEHPLHPMQRDRILLAVLQGITAAGRWPETGTVAALASSLVVAAATVTDEVLAERHRAASARLERGPEPLPPEPMPCVVCMGKTSGRCGCGEALCGSCWHTVGAVQYNHRHGRPPENEIERRSLAHIDHSEATWSRRTP